MESILHQSVTSADKKWVAQGFKNEMDMMRAFIDQETGRSLHVWMSQLNEYHKKAFLKRFGRFGVRVETKEFLL